MLATGAKSDLCQPRPSQILFAGSCVLLQLLTDVLPKGVLKKEPFAVKVLGDAVAELRHHPA